MVFPLDYFFIHATRIPREAYLPFWAGHSAIFSKEVLYHNLLGFKNRPFLYGH
jgi:hypothetical protein